ncbi:hypothetical protein K3495_g2235 [Podosphaera aphanis]|nr:hypothetical protein K3495_g2235 [Podosphaera aphanis]
MAGSPELQNTFMYTTLEQISSSSSPSHTRPSFSSPSSSFDEDSYCLKPYVPLSGLPTPPLSCYSAGSPYQTSFDPNFLDDCKLLGPSVLLRNLIPPCTSLRVASMSIIYNILKRSNLPLDTIALAVIILDSLNSRFALLWRKSCPLVSVADADQHEGVKDQHIDSLRPELVALASLILAHKFLDDGQLKIDDYCKNWGNELWTREQVNFTQRVLLENIGYRLFSLSKDSIISATLEDMERAEAQYTFN